MEELYELTSQLHNCESAEEFLNVFLNIYLETKNASIKQNAMFSLLGVVDTLYFCKQISQEKFTEVYKLLGL